MFLPVKGLNCTVQHINQRHGLNEQPGFDATVKPWASDSLWARVICVSHEFSFREIYSLTINTEITYRLLQFYVLWQHVQRLTRLTSKNCMHPIGQWFSNCENWEGLQNDFLNMLKKQSFWPLKAASQRMQQILSRGTQLLARLRALWAPGPLDDEDPTLPLPPLALFQQLHCLLIPHC